MSIADKITRLQNAKTSIATAITTKGGTVQSGDGFEDFSTDIATIPSGITPTGNINITDTQQTDVTNYATAQVVDADLVAGNIKKDVDILGVTGTFEGNEDMMKFVHTASQMFRAVNNLPTNIILNFSYFGNVSNNSDRGKTDYMFYRSYDSSGIVSQIDLTINFPTTLRYFSLDLFLYQAYGIKTVTLTGNLSGVYSYNAIFNFMDYLREVNIEFDFTSCVGNQNIYSDGGVNNYVTDLNFKESTLKLSCNISKFAALNDTSLVSIANSINESSVATLTLHATPKARCSTIMGTVALDPTSTYHVFTADASGTVTLADFITSTKGWTLA